MTIGLPFSLWATGSWTTMTWWPARRGYINEGRVAFQFSSKSKQPQHESLTLSRKTGRSLALHNSALHFQGTIGRQSVLGLIESGQLRVGQPDGRHEQEADRVADQVTGMRDAEAQREKEVEGSAATESSTRGTPNTIAPSGGGQALPDSVRSYFGFRFGRDFGKVRIFTDALADTTARTLGARAFTLGADIAFARDQYEPDSASGRRLLAHELAHVIQQEGDATALTSRTVRLKRNPDVVHKGHYSFYLSAGREREFAVQFGYPGSGTTVGVKIAHQPSPTMRQGTISIAESAVFNPVATVEGPTTTLFDLNDDGNEELAVQTVIDDYHQQFLTDETTPTRPSIKQYPIRDVYMVATLGGKDNLSFEVRGSPPEEAIAPPIWTMQSHPHPHVGMVWINTRSGRYVIPPIGDYSLEAIGRTGPPPYFRQVPSLRSLRRSYAPQSRGDETVADPFEAKGPTQEGQSSLAHERLREMAGLENEEVPSWGATDVAWWKTVGSEKYLFGYKDRWVHGYRRAIRSAADTYDIPRVLLAGVAYVEVGGDPDWIDEAAYAVRGREGELTTSIAPMSLQIRRAATELGYNPDTMTGDQMDRVLESLQDPQQAIFLAGRHLAMLRNLDFAGKTAADLTADEVAVIATRYNHGPDVPLAQIRLNLDYGIAILRRGERLLKLLED